MIKSGAEEDDQFKKIAEIIVQQLRVSIRVRKMSSRLKKGNDEKNDRAAES